MHFIKYPLLTQKRVDFLLFKSVVELINRKEHLTTEGLHKIVSIRASINNGLSEELTRAFPNIIPVDLPTVEATENPDPQLDLPSCLLGPTPSYPPRFLTPQIQIARHAQFGGKYARKLGEKNFFFFCVDF